MKLKVYKEDIFYRGVFPFYIRRVYEKYKVDPHAFLNKGNPVEEMSVDVKKSRSEEEALGALEKQLRYVNCFCEFLADDFFALKYTLCYKPSANNKYHFNIRAGAARTFDHGEAQKLSSLAKVLEKNIMAVELITEPTTLENWEAMKSTLSLSIRN